METDPIKRQFERWVYPPPVDDLSQIDFNAPQNHFLDVRRAPWNFWPATGLHEDIDILVAGCGTTAGPCFAHCYPRAHVVGIDISEPSLACARRLKDRHNFHNLTLMKLPVEQAHTLGASFDLVAVHGVLHHLPDPVAGMASLGRTLKPDGVISCMLYGKYGRLGVYMFQELFRLLGLGHEPQDVQVVKQAVHLIGPLHPLKTYLASAADLPADAAFVDTFLSGRDRPYTVPEVLDLVERAGLAFAGWDENALYSLDAMAAHAEPLKSRIGALPEARQWEAVELLFGRIAGHFFHVCRKDRDPALWQHRVDTDAFLEYTPIPRITQVQADPATRLPTAIARPPFPPVPLDAGQSRLLAQVDSRRNVRQCIESAGVPADSARAFLRFLWNIGYIMLRMPHPSGTLRGF
ncbi:MAG: class I SAM-dependent methyltransferase [Tepidisphaerales bacterium]